MNPKDLGEMNPAAPSRTRNTPADQGREPRRRDGSRRWPLGSVPEDARAEVGLVTPESPDVLEEGTWVRRGLTYVWEPAPPPSLVVMEHGYDPHDLIACPSCHARMDEFCTRPDGDRRPHLRRLVGRVCRCGGPVPPFDAMCGFCRADLITEKEAA